VGASFVPQGSAERVLPCRAVTSISDLINEAHDTSVRISVLLRKALAHAASTGDESLTTWLNYELNGYGPSKDIPDYRRPKGMLLAYGPFGRIAPVMFRPEQMDLEELMCCQPIAFPITKIEAELDNRRGDRSITATVNPVTMDAVREHWNVECAGIQYTTADFQNILEGARTRLVASLAKLRSVPGPNPLEPRRSPVAWFKALSQAWQFLIGISTIIGTIVAVYALGPCKPLPVNDAPSTRDSSTVPPARTGHSAQADTHHVSQVSPPTPVKSWSPTPYTALKIRGLRTHPVDFKLYGDSVIVDVVMEPGDSTHQRWPIGRPSRPVMKFEVHSTRLYKPGRLDEWLQEGQWVVAEKDRAVFVVPKNRIMFRNLRLVPSIRLGSSSRDPRVEGKWIRREDPRAWRFLLRVDENAAVVKKKWEYTDLAPVF
jgi:hypothetical protein